MNRVPTESKVAQTFGYVKSPSPGSMIHHKVIINNTLDNNRHTTHRIILRKGMCLNHYGVSSSQRIISPGLMLKKFDYIRDCLDNVVGLTTAQREVTLRLIRFWAYYGNVYPKESAITLEPGCSKTTFWRTIRILRELGLIRVVNRYILRPHAQISNLYLLHNLVVVIARYLAEHGQDFKAKWLRPFLQMTGAQFWSQCQEPGRRIFDDMICTET